MTKRVRWPRQTLIHTLTHCLSARYLPQLITALVHTGAKGGFQIGYPSSEATTNSGEQSARTTCGSLFFLFLLIIQFFYSVLVFKYIARWNSLCAGIHLDILFQLINNCFSFLNKLLCWVYPNTIRTYHTMRSFFLFFTQWMVPREHLENPFQVPCDPWNKETLEDWSQETINLQVSRYHHHPLFAPWGVTTSGEWGPMWGSTAVTVISKHVNGTSSHQLIEG